MSMNLDAQLRIARDIVRYIWVKVLHEQVILNLINEGLKLLLHVRIHPLTVKVSWEKTGRKWKNYLSVLPWWTYAMLLGWVTENMSPWNKDHGPKLSSNWELNQSTTSAHSCFCFVRTNKVLHRQASQAGWLACPLQTICYSHLYWERVAVPPTVSTHYSKEVLYPQDLFVQVVAIRQSH